MRLHRLEVEAFGPFAERTVVDFGTLSEAGLFLLSGATGAGKTSVLDAVCFALYGDVPGDRGAAKRLRCDQAAPGVAPRVRLEVTLGVRRFRIERSPSWERPKRRGDGLTTQHASVTMSELLDGAWVPLSSRLDETGDLVGRLVGMNLVQFTQVAMLPQGRFQTFLRARSEERHQLLQQLFRTGRFAEVERWLRDRRLALGRADVETHQRVAAVVSRLCEATGHTLPDGWDVHDLREVADRCELGPWAADLLARSEADLETREQQARSSAHREQAARDETTAARAEVARRARYEQARDEHAGLLDRAEQHDHSRRRLAAARRAASVVPLHRHAVAAAAAATGATERLETAHRALEEHLAPGEAPLSRARDEIAAAADGAAAAAAQGRASLPRVARLVRARAEVDEVTARIEQVTDQITDAGQQMADLPGRVAGLRSSVEASRAAAERVRALTESGTVLELRLRAHVEVERLDAELQAATREWLTAKETSLDLKEQLIELQHARIEGMAAELAGALASGCSCPVCGSADHPAKATAAAGAPDAAAEKSARVRSDDASAVEHAHDAKVHELRASLAAARERSGGGEARDLGSELDTVRDELEAAHLTADSIDLLLAQLADAEDHQDRLQAALTGLTATHARLEARADSLATETSSLSEEVDALLADTPHADLETLVDHAQRTETLARTVLTLGEQAAAAGRSASEARAAAEAAATGAGFADVDGAADAALPEPEVDALERDVEEHRRRVAAVTEVLAEPDHVILESPPPALEQLERAHAEALALRDDAVTALHVAASRRERLTRLCADLDREIGPWATLRKDLELTTRLAGFVEGKSADNRLKMRLSAYVLAYRLGQVVAAANERLARMSDQRYSLEHTGHRGAGETRGGLSLLVRDDWSGETRDPATLSGGETFVVSLALALGLSDVVTHESGGAALDTLFVDEGFGSLDADTLDDVMDTLDSLRDGGRVVGLVSHVAEMRDRIPTQLVVTKARRGSSVRLA